MSLYDTDWNFFISGAPVLTDVIFRGTTLYVLNKKLLFFNFHMVSNNAVFLFVSFFQTQ